jgi:hypothetical protein
MALDASGRIMFIFTSPDRQPPTNDAERAAFSIRVLMSRRGDATIVEPALDLFQTGFLAKRCMLPTVRTHGRASSQNISRAIVTDFGSSSVPMLRITKPCESSVSSAIDEPHFGQKCLWISFPLPPGLENVSIVPLNVSASFGIASRAPNALPVNF